MPLSEGRLLEFRGALRTRTVAKLAGVTVHQLRHWHESILLPAHAAAGSRGYPRLWSWSDYMKVRVAERLRRQGRKPLSTQKIRKIIEFLDDHYPDWYLVPVYGFAGSALVDLKDELVKADAGKQLAFPDLPDLLEDMAAEGPLGELRSFGDYVDMRPDVIAGSPVLKGTRLETAFIAGLASRGMSVAEIAEAYHLNPEQVEQAISFQQQAAA